MSPLTRRLLVASTVTVLAVFATLGVVLDRVLPVAVGGAVLAAVLGALAVSLVSRTLTRPLGRMTASVARMAAGDLAARVPPDGSAELELLAETLNEMAAELGARMEQSARERETRDRILSAMGEGVLLVERDGAVGYANPAASRLLGDAVATRSLPGPVRRLVAEALGDGAVREDEVETGHPSRTVQVAAVPASGDGRVLVVLRDVTAARRLEAVRRDFVANASHELKTPVASIQASAETIRRALTENPPEAAAFAERLERDAVRLSRLVSDLLDLSRLETERPVLEPVRLDLLAREECERLRERARAGGLSLKVAAEPATVRGSAKDLSLLVANLLDNALRFTRPGGTVRLEVGAGDGDARLTVHDTGIGIPSRDLPRVFERFYRVDPARSRETGGTGLGLSIARHVAELHGGRIEAESELGRGSTFRVILPAV